MNIVASVLRIPLASPAPSGTCVRSGPVASARPIAGPIRSAECHSRSSSNCRRGNEWHNKRMDALGTMSIRRSSTERL
jgi:hypothetical protein